jgi:diguanylate cyclase (GGDEF)-like protein
MLSVLDCLTQQHDYRFVALAAIVCIAGCWVTLRLHARTRRSAGGQRLGWIFLSAVAAGSVVWTTHFIAMLGFEPLVPHGYEPYLTLLSWFIAVGAACAALWIATSRHRFAALAGGAAFGAGIGVMHYTGMGALLIPGVVQWDPLLVGVSVTIGMTLSGAALHLLTSEATTRGPVIATGLLALAIVTLHFTGMGAITIIPDPTIAVPQGHFEKSYLALAILAIMLVVVGTVVAAQAIDWQSERSALAQYRYLALHDGLTDLPNRSQAAEVVTRWLDEAKATDRQVAVIGVDLNRFKDVNDVYGHSIGDELLKSLACRVERGLAGDEFIARIGGDEFLAAKVVGGEREAFEFARKLIGMISRPVHQDGRILAVGASCGVALFPEDGDTTDDLILRADLAMYRAKSMKTDSVCRYSAEMDEQARHRGELSLALRGAIEKDELVLYFQPQMTVAGGDVVGFEALLRWRHPERGLVAPADFIPIVEETGMIVPIGEWVLETACRQATLWPGQLTIAVNVSPTQFLRSDFAGTVRECLLRCGLAPSRLELEITESVLIQDLDHALQTLRRLKELGVRIAMDDFGTGYSSLSTLQAFPFDKLKIDRSVTANLVDNGQAATIVRAVIGLAKSLNIPVLAEGVESRQHLAFLRRARCDEVQGFEIGRPMPAHAIADYLEYEAPMLQLGSLEPKLASIAAAS